MTKRINKDNNLEIFRHSLSHIMAAAVQELWPGVKFAIGPAIDEGFYYDFDFGDGKFGEDDLIKTEKKMKHIVKQNLSFDRFELKINDAIRREQKAGEVYKAEMLQDLKTEGEKSVSYYRLGEFEDLCRGPHLESSGKVPKGCFKLTKLAGAYWRGDEKNRMLTRIYGAAFGSKQELDGYLKMITEAEKRDHRKLGRELDLFMIDEETGAGLPLWLPKGALLRQSIEDFVLGEYQKRGYRLVRTPHIASFRLFEQSGHLGFYREGMYSPMDIDGEDYYVKPMNCPFHVKIYKRDLKSYRDLPVRYTELGTVYRYERSGTLHGLTRVRGFTQDDAHIICTPDQLTDELVGVIDITKYILNTFGFDKFKVVLSVRDPENKDKFLGTDREWNLAEEGLKKALKISGWEFETEEGEAVFYGPKIDIKAFDAVGREWQISTLQLDFNLPKRFDMSYVDKDGSSQKPFMLHRALLGSIERFTGILIEHYAGAFPVWLSPVQVKIISVGEAHVEYCRKLAGEFSEHGIRAEVDDAGETVGNKIRKAAGEKVPYVLVIGDKEMDSDKLAVRDRGSDKVRQVGKDEFVGEIVDKIRDRQ